MLFVIGTASLLFLAGTASLLFLAGTASLLFLAGAARTWTLRLITSFNKNLIQTKGSRWNWTWLR
jgi:hypothetical protein